MQTLSDAEWRELTRLSGLPNEARSDVENVIAFMREKPPLEHPRVARIKVEHTLTRKAHKTLSAARGVLAELIEHRVYRGLKRPLLVGPDNDAKSVYVSKGAMVGLQDEVSALISMLMVLGLNQKRALRPGRPRGHVGEAIRGLDLIFLEHSQKHMSTAKGRGQDHVAFVRKVFEFAGTKIEPSTIATVIKETRAKLKRL